MMEITEFCHNHGELNERFALIDMPRASKDFAGVELESYYAQLSLKGSVDSDGRCILQGVVNALMPAVCQRCNELMRYEVNNEFLLSLVADDQEAKELPENYEPLISDDGKLDCLSIVEDELILAQPIAAKHDIDDCKVKKQDWHFEQQTSSSENPFADLMKLKQNKQ